MSPHLTETSDNAAPHCPSFRVVLVYLYWCATHCQKEFVWFGIISSEESEYVPEMVATNLYTQLRSIVIPSVCLCLSLSLYLTRARTHARTQVCLRPSV